MTDGTNQWKVGHYILITRLKFKQRLDALKPKDLSLVNVAREGDVQALRELCGEGVNVDYQDSVGASTPLMTAANWGNSDCVEFLLSKGAKIDMQDKVPPCFLSHRSIFSSKGHLCSRRTDERLSSLLSR